jgi:hypothetical protein
MTHITKPCTVLHLGEKWLALNADHIQDIAAYPKSNAPISVIETFGDSPSGVMRLLGKAAHAAALIERKVRMEGLVDGESRVLIHAERSVSGTMEVLFTAVPLPIWQRVSSWVAGQPDHCTLLPLAAVACAGVKAGQGRVVRFGANFVYFADTAKGFVYAAVATYSEAIEDLEIAVRALAEQALAHCTEAAEDTVYGKKDNTQVEWCSLYADTVEDQWMQALFASVSGLQLTDCGQAVLTKLDASGHNTASLRVKTAAPFLMQRLNISMSANTRLAKLAALAESWIPMSTVAAAACTLGLLAFGAYHQTAATSMNANTEKKEMQSIKHEQAIKSMEAKRAPAEYEAIQGFVNTLQDSVTGYNPSVVLNDIRVAAGRQIRVLRVRLENIPTKPQSILLDGALHAGVDASAVTVFLLQLKRAGYVVTPLAPADGGQFSNFTYRLVHSTDNTKNPTTALTASANSKGSL